MKNSCRPLPQTEGVNSGRATLNGPKIVNNAFTAGCRVRISDRQRGVLDGGVRYHLLPLERHPRGHYIIFYLQSRCNRGHNIAFCPLERHLRFIIFSLQSAFHWILFLHCDLSFGRTARGHFIAFCLLEIHDRGHLTIFCPVEEHYWGHFYLLKMHHRGIHLSLLSERADYHVFLCWAPTLEGTLSCFLP